MVKDNVPPGTDRFPAAVTRAVTVGAALWTLSVVFFVVQAIAIAASARPYSLATNLISDLGNTSCGPDICSPLHGLVNATFVVVGLCHGFGAAGTYRAWPRRNPATFGVPLLFVAGAGLIVAGLAPENVSPDVHRAWALAGLICLNLGMLALGWSVMPVRRWLGGLALSAGVVGLVGLALFLASPGPIATGAAERLADYPGAAMVVVLGIVLLRSGWRAR